MKKLLPFLAGALFVTLQACQTPGCTDPAACNYDPNATVNNNSCDYSCYNNCTGGPIVVSGHITSNETWSPPCMYYLDGIVVVDPGVTLIIEPGTIVKGMQGFNPGSSLVITQGAKIIADGTASEPIIFTSELDNIASGQITGTNLTKDDYGLWGGIIVLGNAPVSDATTDTYGTIEGTSFTYGGNSISDDSGILNYVSIRHGGSLIGAGNELNGLTLGGVGSGTQISNIEVISNIDDGIEIFGGTVNLNNIIIGFQGDDGIDIDQNYAGTVDNFIIRNSMQSDECLEFDGPEGTTNTTGYFTVLNGTCIPASASSYNTLDLKSRAQGTITNLNLGASSNAKIKVRASYQNCSTPEPDAFMNLTGSTPTLFINNVEHAGAYVYTASVMGQINCPVPTADQSAVQNAVPSSAATGASLSNINWTWMHANGWL